MAYIRSKGFCSSALLPAALILCWRAQFLSRATGRAPPQVLPIGTRSPAYNATPACVQSDGLTLVTVDQRGIARPMFGECDVGAYEFDGDYIFAANNDVVP